MFMFPLKNLARKVLNIGNFMHVSLVQEEQKFYGLSIFQET